MRLKEILTLIDLRITLEISGEKESYETKADIPETRMDYEIKTIRASDNSLVIKLGKLKKTSTLEELGYCFETGGLGVTLTRKDFLKWVFKIKTRKSAVKENKGVVFSPPDITYAEIEEVIKVMKSGWITTGPKTKEFERKIAEFVGVNKTACLSSATAAMELVLRVLGIGPGDEVITSAYTYTASASIIDHVGAKIILVDTAPDSFEMDYIKLADAITEKTKAVIPVDIAGKMCNYDAIYDVIDSKKNLFTANNELQKLFNRVIVLADAAHALGAERKGIKCGQAADFTCFSFHAVKNVTTAEGGAVVWKDEPGLDDEEIYKQFMLYSLHGQSKDALTKTQKGGWEYDIIYPAYKYNMTDISASFGIVQLSRYRELMKKRKEIIKLYDKRLLPLGIENIEHYGKDFSSSGHLYLTRIPGINEEKRNEIIIKMAEAGIATNVHYKPLPMFTAYKNLGFNINDYPNAYNQYANEISLPLHTLLSKDDVERVIKSLKMALPEIR